MRGSRSPHGERGLKSVRLFAAVVGKWSLPTRGAWIEITTDCNSPKARTPSLPTRGAWIEIADERKQSLLQRSRSPHGERGLKFKRLREYKFGYESLPTRGAWIEIVADASTAELMRQVAPHTGSVD